MSRCRRVGIFLLLVLAWPASVQAFGSCRDEGYLSSFGVEYAPQSCRTVMTTEIRWRGGSAPMRVIVPDAPTPALNTREAEFIRSVEQLAQRIGRGMDQIGGLQLRPVTILLTDGAYNNFHAVTEGRHGDECRVTYLKGDDEISQETFLFTYSHEIFHCIQGRTWLAQYKADGRGPMVEGQVRPGDWWIEGSAEYFALLVNPGSSQSDMLFSAFDEMAESTPLPEMDYPAVVFFLWLHQTREPRGVGRFIEDMTIEPGPAAQRAALRAQIPLDQWLDFGQTYLDSRLRQPGGRTPTWLINGGERVVFDRPRSHRSFADEFTLPRETFVFKKGRTYTLAIEGAVGELRSRFNQSTGVWIDPPSLVRACDDDISHLVLTTAIEGDNLSQTFVVDQSERLDERACCLVGQWSPTDASRAAELELLMSTAAGPIAAYGAQLECGANGGDWILEFTADGQGAVRWDGFSYQCMVFGTEGAAGNRFTRQGATSFDWTVDDRGVGVATYTENSLVWHHTMMMGPMENSRVMHDAGPSTESNAFDFQCTDTTLSVQGIYGLNYGPGTYTRIGPPPATRP